MKFFRYQFYRTEAVKGGGKARLRSSPRMVADGFSELQTRLDVTEQIKSFERKFHKLEQALHIKL